MKRFSLTLATFASAVLAAPAPKPAAPVTVPEPVAAAEPAYTPAPAPAPVAVAPAPTTASTAPVTPATNRMVQSNIALPGGINALSYVPHRYAGKQFAVFQWAQAGGTEAWGAFDNWATNFHLNGGLGDLAGYWMTPDMAVGAVVNFHRAGEWLYYEDEFTVGTNKIKTTYESNSDTALVLDGLELVYSQPYGDLAVFANAHFRSAGNTFTADSSVKVSGGGAGVDTSISDEWSGVQRRGGLTLGARSFAGANGSAWQAQLTWDVLYTRAQPGDDEVYTHYVRAYGRWAKRRDVENGLIIGYGINPEFLMIDGEETPDVRAGLLLPPNLALELPLFQNWTLKGGATLPVRFVYNDTEVGDNENVTWTLTSEAPVGNLGLRYGRGRWAAEAGVTNGFLNNGPYFLSGVQDAGTLVNFALAVDLK